MSHDVMVTLISFIGTLVGTFGGILTSSRLSNYRIEQLEKKVEKHNNLVERMYNIEGRMDVVQEQIQEIKEDVQKLEK